MEGIGRGSAKLILFGEHAAVHGHPAVGVSLPESTTVRLADRPGHGGHGSPWHSDDWDLASVAESDRETVAAVIARLGELVPGVAPAGVQVESEVPRAAGFGSSAALCTAFARAVSARSPRMGLPRLEEEVDTLWRLAHELEKLFHGTPSGIDTGLSIREGTYAFHPRPGSLPAVERLPGALPALVVGAVPREGSCGALVADLSRRVRGGDAAAIRSVDALGGMAQAAAHALRPRTAGTARLLGELADRAMEVLRGLGLSVPGLDALLDVGKRAGALGGKLSGAGGGGAFYLVAPDDDAAVEIARRVGDEAAWMGIRLVSGPRVRETRAPSAARSWPRAPRW